MFDIKKIIFSSIIVILIFSNIFAISDKKILNEIAYIEVSGSYFEMGLQYGKLLKKEIKEIYQEFETFLEIISPKGFESLTDMYFKMRVKTFENRIPEEYRQELRGIAYGSGVSYDKLLLIPVIPEFIGLGCTSFITQTKEGYMLGRNLDYSPGYLGNYPVVVKYSPKNKKSFYSFGVAGFPGVLTGINEDGLTLSLDQIQIANKEFKNTIPIGYKNREVLENAGDLEQAEKIFEDYKPDMGWAITLLDSYNKGAVFDLSPLKTEKNSMDKNYILVNNFTLNEELRRKIMSINQAEKSSNIGRFLNTQNMLKKGTKNIEDVLNILNSYEYFEYNNYELGSTVLTTNNSETIHSIVINPSNFEAYFSSSETFSGGHVFNYYDLKNNKISTYRTEKNYYEKAKSMYLDMNEIYLLFFDGKYKESYEYIKQKEEINFNDVYLLNELMMIDEIIVEKYYFIDKVKDIVSRYPEIGFIHIWEARGYLSNEEIEKSLNSLNKALKSKYIYNAERLEVYKLYFDIYYKIKDVENMKLFYERYVDLANKYILDSKTEKIIDEMKNKIKNDF